ncbi:MAG: BlaI/MecI/CopY family transcriptional regulator [Acidobacteria bacterium]|nr:BlaI/MecI/CopY family transcriptional regulator [Acidobacteriota bacterium]
MRKTKSAQLTPLELEIMQILWETEQSNVQVVQHKLKRELAYTTVQTMLNVLHRKGKVKRILKDRAYFYSATVSERKIIKQSLGDMINRLFGGSAESLVMSLVETKQLTPEKLAELHNLIGEKEKEDGKNK